MKLKIDDWIEQERFSIAVNVLLKDSSLCYKAGAYRASLLFSYLGFLTILKERIISANKPQNYIEGEWNSLITKIRNEDKWEEAVFDSTQQKVKIDQSTKDILRDPVFSIKDDTREQIKYWKNRRNDCAHFKENNIDYYHIESFWAFLESNLPKITIEGGLNTLINKIKDHFNPILTPPDKDFTYLVKDIEHSVEPSKLSDFWDKFIVPSEWDFRLSKTRKSFLKECFRISTEVVKDSIVDKLKENKYYLIDFLDTNPELLSNFNFTSQEIRKLWSLDLSNSNNPIGILASLLRNALIPMDQIEEANKSVLNRIEDYSPNVMEHHTLENNNFLSAFKSEIIENSSFIGFQSYLWVNHRADLISGIIKSFPADKDIIVKLSKHYDQDYSSEWLLQRFDYHIDNGDQFAEKYRVLVQNENLSLSKKLEKYFA
ncbi:hypothetical protein [Leeuwenhoekiella sp. H156]|uniref:hypothetical protein n=1 Tax=Leeuwenhoekiella sp. H156 TaxID=3450128 RepID=UPI003FA473C3